MSLLSLMIGQPMFITQSALDVMMTIAARETVSLDQLERYRGGSNPRDDDSPMTIRGDVAVIPIQGPIFRHATLFRQISGATTTDQIALDLGMALDNPEVKGIVLKVNSPGGEAASIGELAGMVRDANQQKPVTTYFDFLGASAAYYIGAAAGRRVANAASFVGSIGTLSAWTSTKKAKAMLGLEDMVVVSPQTPKKGLDPESAEGLAQLQDHLRYLSDLFIDDVASFTGVSRKRVLSDFGQGALVNADAALAAGMIDDLGTMEGTLAAVSGGRRYRKPAPSPSAASEVPVAKKTLGQWLLGSRADQPVPDALQDPPPSPASEAPPVPAPGGASARGSSGQDDDEEKAELRRQLAEERQLRQSAESRANEDARIKDKVASWVRSGRIDPAQAVHEVKLCLDLSAADQSLKLSGDSTLLARYEAQVDARRATSPTREQVPDPPSGGRTVVPPATPQAADPSSSAAKEQKERELAELKEFAARQFGLVPSGNGVK